MRSPGSDGKFAAPFRMARARLSMAECAAVSRDPSHGKRRFRGIGHGRKTRRVLDRGGTGPARALNATLGTWDGVRITPMFGRWGYFVGPRLFACFPLRDKDHDLWIRLAPGDQPRALREAGVRPHRRSAPRGRTPGQIQRGPDAAPAPFLLPPSGGAATSSPCPG